jgi:hypothetical protein
LRAAPFSFQLFSISAFLFSGDAAALPASRFSGALARSAFQFSAFQHFSFSLQRGRRRPTRFALFRSPCAQRLSVFSFSAFQLFSSAGTPPPYSLRAFPDPLRAAPFGFSVFSFSAFQLFSSAGTPSPYPLRAFPEPLRAAPFSFQLFSFSAFLFSGDAAALLASRFS